MSNAAAVASDKRVQLSYADGYRWIQGRKMLLADDAKYMTPELFRLAFVLPRFVQDLLAD
jgi:spermidine synthase